MHWPRNCWILCVLPALAVFDCQKFNLGNFMRKTPVSVFAMTAFCAAFTLPVLAQDSGKEALYTRSLAASCAGCHGTDGKVVQGSTVTSLAGLDRAYFIAQMTAFKSGTRTATVMHQISKGFSDAQIASMAGYFSAQKK